MRSYCPAEQNRGGYNHLMTQERSRKTFHTFFMAGNNQEQIKKDVMDYIEGGATADELAHEETKDSPGLLDQF